MKTTIEMNGYEIVIEETAGMLSVTAMKDGETVEEFSLETEGGEEQEGQESEVQERRYRKQVGLDRSCEDHGSPETLDLQYQDSKTGRLYCFRRRWALR